MASDGTYMVHSYKMCIFGLTRVEILMQKVILKVKLVMIAIVEAKSKPSFLRIRKMAYRSRESLFSLSSIKPLI